MSEMVERVAKSLWEKEREMDVFLLPWDQTTSGLQAEMMVLARAAIAAMREPTDKMVAAGINVRGSTEREWRAMIDEALKD